MADNENNDSLVTRLWSIAKPFHARESGAASLSSRLISALTMLATFFLVSCGSEDDVVKQFTSKQKETYAQNISGEYPG